MPYPGRVACLRRDVAFEVMVFVEKFRIRACPRHLAGTYRNLMVSRGTGFFIRGP
jgi:hypothetical protein